MEGRRSGLLQLPGTTLDERLKPEISAPTGVSVVTYGKYPFDGTSSSTPHVAGAAALIWQAYPQWTRQEVIDYLLEASKDLGPVGPDTGFGYGRLQLPAPPEGMAIEPFPTQERPMPEDDTLQPLPTPTSVVFVTPEVTPAPEGGRGSRLIGAALLGVVILGLGAVGFLLVVIAGILWMRGRRAARPAPAKNQPTAFLPPGGRVPFPAPSPRPGPPYGQGYVEGPPAPPVPVPPPVSGPEFIPSVQSAAQESEAARHEPDVVPPPESSEPRPTVICPVCGTAARLGARFCAGCGAPLSMPEVASQEIAPSKRETLISEPGHCPQCGAATRPGARFCAVCGAASPLLVTLCLLLRRWNRQLSRMIIVCIVVLPCVREVDSARNAGSRSHDAS